MDMDTTHLRQQLFKGNRRSISKSIQAYHKLSIENTNFEITCTDFIDPNNSNKFTMFIFDIFEIKNKGILVTGIVSSGTVKKGDNLILQKSNDIDLKTKAVEIEYFNNKKIIPGSQIGIFLKNIDIKDITQGDVLVKRSLWREIYKYFHKLL